MLRITRTKILTKAIFAIIKTSLPASALEVNYEYDKLSQLTKSSTVTVPAFTYTYDALGNRLSLNVANALPAVVSLTPASGTSSAGQEVNFTAVTRDANGWQNIQYVYFLTNASISGLNGAYIYYNQNINRLYLRNNANTAWLGGYAPGSAKIIENYYCRLDCSKVTVLGSANKMTIKYNISFKAAFAGSKNTYLNIKDDTGAGTGWIKKGTWIITQ